MRWNLPVSVGASAMPFDLAIFCGLNPLLTQERLGDPSLFGALGVRERTALGMRLSGVGHKSKGIEVGEQG
jgi:hypothetical protein